NPAFVLKTMLIEKNTLSGNGNNNNPLYMRGSPVDYINRNNIKIASAANPGFNYKQQLLRPLYYEVKHFSPLEFIALVSLFIFLWFSSREYIYAFPAGLIYAAVYLFISFEEGLAGMAMANTCFTAGCIYGWITWAKRDRRHHRIVRVHASSKKEILYQLLFFTISYILIAAALFKLSRYFKPDIIPWADAFICAAAFTGMWLMTRKKVESRYWWMAAFMISVYTYFENNLIFNSAYSFIFFLMSLWGLYQWKRRKLKRRKS
ncbi:MAG: nicotinamide riboside transporter PnuC, partial [Ferruginibacter sp.]